MAKRLLKAGLGGDVVAGAAEPRRRKTDAGLFADPMPDRVEPCLAQLASKPPEGPNWAFEVKWDGYRLAVHLEDGKVRVLTRGGHDWTHRFPAIASDMLRLEATSAILDGEAVVLDDRGASDFNALQRALGRRGGKPTATHALLYAFDLLYLDGHDLRKMGLADRRHMLASILPAKGSILMSEEVDADGSAFLKLACEMGLEGIIAKKRDAPYRPGRGGDWLKIKCVQSETFAIVGYEPSPAALGGIGRLLLGGRRGADLAYVGGVGTGLTTRSATELRQRLNAQTRDRAPVPLKRKGVVWVEPTLAAEIAFRGWTNDAKLRHASYKALREAADNAEIFDLDGLE